MYVTSVAMTMVKKNPSNFTFLDTDLFEKDQNAVVLTVDHGKPCMTPCGAKFCDCGQSSGSFPFFPNSAVDSNYFMYIYTSN